MSKDKIPTLSQLRWSMNKNKTLYTWGVQGLGKRTSTRNGMSDGIPIHHDDNGEVIKIPSDQLIRIWLKEYFQTGDSPTVKYKWSMNKRQTCYYWGLYGSDKRTSTKNEFTKGIRIEYHENGRRKKTPCLDAINKWEKDYFRSGDEEELISIH